jgi:hypothetical protein
MRVARLGVLLKDEHRELDFQYLVPHLCGESVSVVVIGGSGDRTRHSKLGYPVLPDLTLGDARDWPDAAVAAAGGKSGSPEAVIDGAVITARSADSLPAFFHALDATLHQQV